MSSNCYTNANCRHVVLRTLSLRNVFFRKAIFTRHPDLLEWVLGEFPRIWRCFVLHSVLRWGGGGRGGNTGPFPVMLLWRWPVFHPRCSAGMEAAVSTGIFSVLVSRAPLWPQRRPTVGRNDRSTGAAHLLLSRKWRELCGVLRRKTRKDISDQDKRCSETCLCATNTLF